MAPRFARLTPFVAASAIAFVPFPSVRGAVAQPMPEPADCRYAPGPSPSTNAYCDGYSGRSACVFSDYTRYCLEGRNRRESEPKAHSATVQVAPPPETLAPRRQPLPNGQSTRLAVGPSAGGYECPDGRQLYVKSCYDESPGASCGVVNMHLPPRNGFQVETVETRSKITASVVQCKVLPLQFRSGTVSLVHSQHQVAQRRNPAATASQSAERLTACSRGDGQACFALGDQLDRGVGVAKDAVKALRFYSRACDLRHGEACYRAGLQFDTLSRAPDLPRAVGLYRRACDLKSGNGCFSLGMMYRLGNGVKRDEALGNALMDEGCKIGSAACRQTRGVPRQSAR